MILRTIAVFLSLASLAIAADIERTTVYEGGQDGYHTYRIPAAVLTKSGTVLAFAEGRKNAGADSGDIDLLVKRSADGGHTFSPQQIVWDDADNTCGNPCPVMDETTGCIILLMTHNLGSDKEPQLTTGESKGKRTVWVTSSDDDGLTWTAPREVTQQVTKSDWTWYATGPGIGIQIKNGPHKGRLVIPCDHVIKPGGANTGNSHVIFSDDAGATWKLGGESPKNEFNESQIVELSNGKLMLNMRNYAPAVKAGAPKHRGICLSDDGGLTFNNDLRRDPTLIEPICQASILRYDSTKILFANPASTEKRERMTVRLSEDDAGTWKSSREIDPGPSAYSCLVVLPDNKGGVGLLYECGDKRPYERIELARFRIDDMKN